MSEEALALLRSIDNSLKQILKVRQASTPQPVASDRDLDGKYGDPVLKVMPRDWTGPTFKNAHFSECPAPLLDQVADMLDYFAQKAEAENKVTRTGKPVAGYNRADAARARGWAKRIREGTHHQPVGVGSGVSQNGNTDPDWADAEAAGASDWD